MNSALALRTHAWAAACWGLLFGLLSFYWALGGQWLLRTLSPRILALAQDPSFLFVVALTGALKVAAGVVALSLLQPWGERFPRRLRLGTTLLIGFLLTLYALVNLGAAALVALGVFGDVRRLQPPAARWHIFLWEPLFLLGGLLFIGAGWYFWREGQMRTKVQ